MRLASRRLCYLPLASQWFYAYAMLCALRIQGQLHCRHCAWYVSSAGLLSREGRRRERLDRELKEVRASLEARNGELAARAAAHAAAEDQAHRLELMLRDSHVRRCVLATHVRHRERHVTGHRDVNYALKSEGTGDMTQLWTTTNMRTARCTALH